MLHDESRAETPGLERTVMLTDAVVAIAMTLLVLPLVELAPEVDAGGFGTFVGDHRDVFLSFVLSFLVIYVFWLAHGRVFASIRDPGAGMRVLNMLWLLVIAFLPFPTAVVGREATTTTVPVYVGTMFALSALTSAMTQVGARTGRAPSATRWHGLLTWATTAVFGLCAMVGAVNPDLGLLGLLLLILVRVAEVKTPTRGE